MASIPGFEFETTGTARTVGAAHLFFAGATNVATGAALAGLSASGRLLPPAIDDVGRYVSPATALRYGDFLAVAATDGALLAGAALVCLGALACVVSWRSVRRRRSWRSGLALAVCNGANPLALPACFVAFALLVVSREELPVEEDAATVGDDADEEASLDLSGNDSAVDDADYGG